MLRSVTLLATTMVIGTMLTGCGLAETACRRCCRGASQVEQARQAKQTEARVQQQVDAAVQLDADHRHAAEAESQ